MKMNEQGDAPIRVSAEQVQEAGLAAGYAIGNTVYVVLKWRYGPNRYNAKAEERYYSTPEEAADAFNECAINWETTDLDLHVYEIERCMSAKDLWCALANGGGVAIRRNTKVYSANTPAERAYEDALDAAEDAAGKRALDDEALRPHFAVLMGECEPEDYLTHYQWVATAPVAEIMAWVDRMASEEKTAAIF